LEQEQGKLNTNVNTLDADALLIGFTGSIGSGCTFIAKGIRDILSDNAKYYLVSDILRDIAKKNHTEENTKILQDLGNQIRLENGNSRLVELCIEKIKRDSKSESWDKENTIILIDGIKNDGEVHYLRQFPNFYLISIHADKSTRKKRVVGEHSYNNRFNADDDFEKADARDEHEDISYGQQLKKCNYLADIIIYNNTDYPNASATSKRKFFSDINANYIYPIQQSKRGAPAHDRPPSIDETLMTMAYCVSKRSSCLKRKVGAIIAHIMEFENNTEQPLPVQRVDSNKQFQIVSSGYNEVPLGTEACIFSEWQKCYRENLQEILAKKFICCPNCGTKIPEKIQCTHCKTDNDSKTILCQKCNEELLSEYECININCKTKIFRMFLPNGQDAPGKLLDMCRSLHAEENAIIGLAGISKPVNGENKKLVLYTTTFPCNLCANKIVAAGIKTVVYAEPYPMKQAEEILRAGGVKVEKFMGVKSTAYFRLYA